LVHIYENSISAILGDKIGLGKTLQTLALFQYLTENKPTTGEHRPNLVGSKYSIGRVGSE
jgi:SWI/SNF-related matrix-associated actin-dependent regulator of chromatin subfamily A member 5